MGRFPATAASRRARRAVWVLAGVLALAECQALAAPLEIAALQEMTVHLGAAEPSAQISAALAACLLGNGDPQATLDRFAAQAWGHQHDGELGLHDLSPGEGAAAYVVLAEDGAFCDVYSSRVDTMVMAGLLQSVLAATPAGITPVAQDCPAFRLPGGGAARVQGGGQDPLCHSETDAAVRMIFAPHP